MSKILGLDLGTNSIGWAVVDTDQKKILGAGVRIFPEGVEAKTIGQGEKEQSKNATRRDARQMRRQYFRKKLRRKKLLDILIDQGMCPLEKTELEKWTRWDKSEKKEGRKFPSSPKFIAWLKLNPYRLRSKAINKVLARESVELKTASGKEVFEFTDKEVLGRVLYHLIQRRGFLSSRKSKEDGKIYKGDPQKGMVGIDDTFQLVKEHGTLGAALNTVLPKENRPYNQQTDSLRARARYTLRDMYVKEFYEIWKTQAVELGLSSIKVEQKKIRYLKGSIDSKRNKKKLERLNADYGTDRVRIEKVNALYKVTTVKSISLEECLGGLIEPKEQSLEFKSNDSTLFYQRPLRSQKSMLGKCSLENRKFYDKKEKKWIAVGLTPCPISHPDFEWKRAYEFINNIEYGTKQRLDDNQRRIVLDLINSKEGSIKFSEIKKKINLTYEKFNYEDDFAVAGNHSIANLKPLFPHEVWYKEYKTTVVEETSGSGKEEVDKTEYGYERIWHCFYHFANKEMLYEKLRKVFGLDVKYKDAILGKEKDGTRKGGIVLKDGYSNISLKATRNILNYLKKQDEKGNFYKQNEAVLLAGVRNVFGKRWQYFQNSCDEIEKEVIRINRQPGNKEGEAIEKIKTYLSGNDFGFEKNDRAFQRLYHHSQDVEAKQLADKLPVVENLRNPIVQQGLNEMRRLVNDLIKEHGKFDRINVELGRDLKNSKKKRQELTKSIADNRGKNDEARKMLTKYGLRHSRENIQKCLLIQEIESRSGRRQCPYTGQTLNIQDVLGGDNRVQIEHIIPKSISLDDGFANKTLCDSKFNALKGEKTPYQFYKENSDERLWGAKSWEEVKQRAFKLLPYNKAKKFTAETEFKLDSFIERQKNDMRYMSRKAKELLSNICEKVHAMPGGLTAELRHLWGVNNVLQPVTKIQIPDMDIEADKVYPYYLVVDEFNKQVASQRMYNPKPAIKANQTTLVGEIKKDVFSSVEKFTAYKELLEDELPGGEYWRLLHLSKPREMIKVFRDKPDTDESRIVLRGEVKKEKFTNDSLGSIKAQGIADGKYSASIAVKGRKFQKSDKGKEPKKRGKQLLLYGKVQEGIFTSYIYQCATSENDGKYWLLLDLNFDDIAFERAVNEKPESKPNQIVIQGSVNDEGIFSSDIDYEHQFNTDKEAGKYWALFDIIPNGRQFERVMNDPPATEEGQKIVEGNIWVDKYTGEIKFDPKKNREDQRHHAIDAVVIALSEQSYFQKLSTYYGNREEKKRSNPFDKEQLDFPEPWNNFHQSLKGCAERILVSYKQDNKVLTEVRKKVTKNGKTIPAKGMAVRGQLHDKTYYGKNKECQDGEYVKRDDVKSLSVIQLRNIVDQKVRNIIIETILKSTAVIKDKQGKEKQVKLNDEESLIFKKFVNEEKLTKEEKKSEKPVKEKVSEMLKNLSFFMRNEGKRYKRLKKEDNGFERKDVPIKKVRVKRVFNNGKFLKETQGPHLFKNEANDYNQYVNPGNNHHVAIYRTSEGELIEKVVPFWDAVERIKQGEDTIDKNPKEGNVFIESLEKNELFLFKGSYDKDRKKGVIEDIEIDEADHATIGQYLYRCEAVSSEYYEFRHHLESTHNREYRPYYVRIQSFGEGVAGWLTYNPIKVRLTPTGKIEKLKA